MSFGDPFDGVPDNWGVCSGVPLTPLGLTLSLLTTDLDADAVADAVADCDAVPVAMGVVFIELTLGLVIFVLPSGTGVALADQVEEGDDVFGCASIEVPTDTVAADVACVAVSVAKIEAVAAADMVCAPKEIVGVGVTLGDELILDENDTVGVTLGVPDGDGLATSIPWAGKQVGRPSTLSKLKRLCFSSYSVALGDGVGVSNSGCPGPSLRVCLYIHNCSSGRMNTMPISARPRYANPKLMSLRAGVMKRYTEFCGITLLPQTRSLVSSNPT